MRYETQDFSARTRYDTVLPEEAYAELRRPKRPVILGQPVYQQPEHSGILKWVVGFALCVIILAGMLVNYSVQRNTQATLKAIPTVVPKESAPIIQPTPVPVKPAVQPPIEQTRLVIAPAPKAQLVPVPVRRATLYRLPSQELGIYKWYELPVQWGGGSVWARYMGTKEHFSQIPRGPIPGDLWNVTEGNASWIFCTPIGYNHPIWIDP
jgi:hypothetical protein